MNEFKAGSGKCPVGYGKTGVLLQPVLLRGNGKAHGGSNDRGRVERVCASLRLATHSSERNAVRVGSVQPFCVAHSRRRCIVALAHRCKACHCLC